MSTFFLGFTNRFAGEDLISDLTYLCLFRKSVMTSDADKISSTGDLSDFEYESSLYEPGAGSGSSQFGSQVQVDPFSLGPSLGSKMNVPETIALLRDDEMHNYRLSDKMFSANQAANMSIPDRISLDGSGNRDSGFSTGMMGSVVGMPASVTAFSDTEVLTPPRHLKLDEFAFPRFVSLLFLSVYN